jgi:hypothetical protein
MAQGARGPRLGSTARWVIGGLVVALVAWILVSGVVMWSARQHVNDGLDALTRARAAIEEDGLVSGAASKELRAARAAFDDAHALAGGFVMVPWRVIPLVGTNVRSVKSLTEAAARVADVGRRAADDSAVLLDQHPSTGPERLEVLRGLAKVTRRAQRDLRDVDLGPDFFLVGPLGDARERFVERFHQLRSSLADGAAASSGVENMLRGPRRYLVLGANNGEMRAGSGMLLSAGTATFENGTFSLDEMRSTTELPLPAGAVAVPPELERIWGFVPMTRDWRWLATSPRFDVTAPLAAEMWEKATGQRVDGVLALDPVTLEALLRAQGPIEVDDRRLSADDVLKFLLLDQYTFADASTPDQVARRDQLSSVAKAAVDTLETRSWNPDQLARQLSQSGRGRHVLAWARDPAEQRAWTAAGVGGELHANSLAVSLLNTGGNKLDQFLEIESRLEVRPRADGGRDATVHLTVTNRAGTDLPRYVGGPYQGLDLAAGEYQGLVTVNTPGVGSQPALEGLPSLVVAGRDGPTRTVAAGPLRVLPGATATVTVEFVLPGGLTEMLVEPSARVPPIQWRFRGERWEDTAPHTVTLE